MPLQNLTLVLIVVMFPVVGIAQDNAADITSKFVGFPGFSIGPGETDLRLLARPIDNYVPGEYRNLENGFFLLSNPQIRKQLELSNEQRQQFFRLFRQLDAKCIQFGEFGYDELNDWKHQCERQVAFEQLMSHYDRKVAVILLPHQQKQLKSLAHGEKTKIKPFIELIISDPIASAINLKEEQRSELKKHHRKLWPHVTKKLEQAHHEYTTEFISELSPDQQRSVRDKLGKNFVEESYVDLAELLNAPLSIWIAVATVKFEGDNGKRTAKLVAKKPKKSNRFIGLLNLKRVSNELELSDDQKRQFREAGSELEKRLKEQYDLMQIEKLTLTKKRTRELIIRAAMEQESARISRKILLPHQIVILTQFRKRCFAASNGLVYVVSQAILSTDERVMAKLKSQNKALRRKMDKKTRPVLIDYHRNLIKVLEKRQQEKLQQIFGRDFFDEGKDPANK